MYIFVVKQLGQFLSKEVVDANVFNNNLMGLLASFILQLSPFAETNQMDDKRVVDEGFVPK